MRNFYDIKKKKNMKIDNDKAFFKPIQRSFQRNQIGTVQKIVSAVIYFLINTFLKVLVYTLLFYLCFVLKISSNLFVIHIFPLCIYVLFVILYLIDIVCTILSFYIMQTICTKSQLNIYILCLSTFYIINFILNCVIYYINIKEIIFYI